MGQDESPQTLPAGQPELTVTPLSAIGSTNMESSSTDESCGAYIARKWEQLGVTPENSTQGPSGGNVERSSNRITLELAPTQNLPDHTETVSVNSVPRVAFLDPTINPIKSNLKWMYKPSEPKIQKLWFKIGDSRKEFSVSASETEGPSNTEGFSASEDEFRLNDPLTITHHSPSNRSASEIGQESAGLLGSTVADALFAPVDKSRLKVSDADSVTSVDFPEEVTRSHQLSASSRVLMKECFETASPVALPPGHTTLALNESQVNCILRVVADEAVKSSLRTMENLVEPTSRLNLGTSLVSPAGRGQTRKSAFRAPTPGPQSGTISGDASDTSGALRSSDDFASIGYEYEHSDFESQPFTPPPVGPHGCSRVDPRSTATEFQVESPGAQTLAVLKAEAVAEKTKSNSRKGPRKKTTTSNTISRHRVPRACKIMKEACFKGMEWTKTFVSGPVDP